MEDGFELVVLVGLKGYQQGFNNKVGYSRLITNQKGLINVSFPNGLNVPSFSIGEVMYAAFKQQNIKVIHRVPILSYIRCPILTEEPNSPKMKNTRRKR